MGTPPFSSLPFHFGSSGYSAPSFTNVHFSYNRPTYQQTADLQAAIFALRTWKRANTTSLGSTIKSKVSASLDINNFIRPRQVTNKDLLSFIEAVIPPALTSIINSSSYNVYDTLDLELLITSPKYTSLNLNFNTLDIYQTFDTLPLLMNKFKNLNGTIRAFQYRSLTGLIKVFNKDTTSIAGKVVGLTWTDIPSTVYPIPPVDLQSIVEHIIQIKNLSSSINGIWLNDYSDLRYGLRGIGTVHRDLPANIHGYDTAHLYGRISPLQVCDLYSYIEGGSYGITRTITSKITPIPPKVLNASIFGYAIVDLSGYIEGANGPYDLKSTINAYLPKDLTCIIKGFKGIQVTKDLNTSIQGYNISTITANIYPIAPVTLYSSITALTKTLDLTSTIVPKTLVIRKIIQIALLEHLDLKGVINSACILSQGVNLGSSLYGLDKKDLKCYIVGWYGNFADNVVNLNSRINTESYTTTDTLSLNYNIVKPRYTNLGIDFNVNDVYNTFDTMNITCYSIYTKKLLTSSITGVLRSVDLTSSITPEIQWDYTELPSWVSPKSHTVVINLNKLEEQWQRFVEIMFDNYGDTQFNYFYVSAEQKVYKIDRDRQWTILFSSYVDPSESDSMFDRVDYRSKHLFRMSNYATIDAAIRDMIDRVSTFRSTDLTTSIAGIMPPYKDLTSVIKPLAKYSWSKYLYSSITAIE